MAASPVKRVTRMDCTSPGDLKSVIQGSNDRRVCPAAGKKSREGRMTPAAPARMVIPNEIHIKSGKMDNFPLFRLFVIHSKGAVYW